MTREDFINFLKEKDIPFEEYTEHGLDQVWVYSKGEYELKKKNPRKYKNLYVPYLRVSNFDGDWYTRDNGLCGYMSPVRVMEICLYLGDVEA